MQKKSGWTHKSRPYQLDRKNNVIETPDWFVKWVQEAFGIEFDFDPCPKNCIFDNLRDDAEWGMCNFVNPPYAAENGKKNGPEGFIKKALTEMKKGKSSYILIPANTDTGYFENYVFPNYNTLIFLEKIKFVGYKKSFPKTMCLIEFLGNNNRVGILRDVMVPCKEKKIQVFFHDNGQKNFFTTKKLCKLNHNQFRTKDIPSKLKKETLKKIKSMNENKESEEKKNNENDNIEIPKAETIKEPKLETLLNLIKQSKIPELVEMTKNFFVDHKNEISYDKRIISESAKLNDTTLLDFFCGEFKEEFKNKKNKFIKKLLILLLEIPDKMKAFEIVVRHTSKKLHKKCKKVLHVAISMRNIKAVELLFSTGYYKVTEEQFLNEFNIGSVEMMKLYMKNQDFFKIEECIDNFIKLSNKNKKKELNRFFLEMKKNLIKMMDPEMSTPNQNQSDLLLEEELKQSRSSISKKRKMSPMQEAELEKEISEFLGKKMKK